MSQGRAVIVGAFVLHTSQLLPPPRGSAFKDRRYWLFSRNRSRGRTPPSFNVHKHQVLPLKVRPECRVKGRPLTDTNRPLPHLAFPIRRTEMSFSSRFLTSGLLETTCQKLRPPCKDPSF